MITFSLPSVMISILCCNMLIIFLSIIFSSHTYLIRLGFQTLSILLVLVFLRLLFPFELPWSTNIYFPNEISHYIALLLRDRFHVKGFSFSIWNCMVWIWIAVFFYQLYRYVRANRKLLQLIKLCGTDVTEKEPYASFFQEIMERTSCKKEIRIIQNSFCPEPTVFKFRVSYILIPDTLNVNSDEMECILTHEILHILHHDLLIKNLVQVMCMFYWWNPCCSFFRKQIDLFLELHADRRAEQTSNQSKEEYLSSLVKVAKQISHKKSSEQSAGLAFSTQSGNLLNKRLRFLMDDHSSSKHISSVAVLLAVGISCMLSYVFILEPSYVPDGVFTEDIFELTADNCYAVQQSDGTYDIYFNGEYFENTDSLEYYPDGMIVY